MTLNLTDHARVLQPSDAGQSEIRNNIHAHNSSLATKRVKRYEDNFTGLGRTISQPVDAGKTDTVSLGNGVKKPYNLIEQSRSVSSYKIQEPNEISKLLSSDISPNNTAGSSGSIRGSIDQHIIKLSVGKKTALKTQQIFRNATSACGGISTYFGIFVVLYYMIGVIGCAPTLTALKPPDESCKPKMFLPHNSTFEVGSPIDLACKIDTCADVSVVVFAKTDDNLSSTWRSVYEGISNTNHRALTTGISYSLDGRGTEYAALTTYHILLVQQLLLTDHGHWKCQVHDGNGVIYNSNTLELTVYASPKEGNLKLSPNNLELVTNQSVEFECEIADVHPKLNVIWIVNGTEYRQGKPNYHQSTNGLWMVRNNLEFCTEYIGKVNLSCQIKAGGRLTKSIGKNITFIVKEAASIIYPVKEIVIETTLDTSFTLNCTGSGYKPYITWEKDDHPIDKDDFSITTSCSEDSHTCYSLLSPNPARKDVPCVYTGTYFCIVKLYPPYHTTPLARAPKIKLYVLEPKENNHTLMIVFGVTVFAVLVILVGYSLYYKTGGIKCLRLHSGIGNGTTPQSESLPLSPTGFQEDQGEV